MSYADKKNLENRQDRKEIIRRMIISLNLKTQKELAGLMGIEQQRVSDFITRDDSTFYKRIINFAEDNNLSIDELMTGTGKKPVEKAGEYDTKHHEKAVGIYEYTLPEAHRELVTKLVEILDGANRSNAVAIEQNVNAFHQTKDIPIPGEEEDDKSTSDGGEIKKNRRHRESRTKAG